VRRFLLSQLLLIALLVLLNECQKPGSLARSVLGDPRLITGPACVDEAVDVSGSMQQFTPQRERAERELFEFARRELEPTDLISIAFFGETSAVALAPTPLDALSAAPGVPAGIGPNDTLLAPAIDALVASRSTMPTPCAARALIIVTDGVISDPAQTAVALAAASYTRVYAVIPTSVRWWGRPPQLGGDLQPISVYHFTDGGVGGAVASVLAGGKPLDVVLGEIMGALTGQPLQQDTKQQQGGH
jgi:hypothetical protein